MPDPESSPAAIDSIAWQEGSAGTQTYLGSGEVIRCWKLSNRFDCLYARTFDIREQIADAPVRRAYYRFLTSRLPDRMGQLEGLDLRDGYECSTSSSPDRSILLEAVWKNGRIVEQSSINQQDSSDTPWTPEQIAELFRKYGVVPRRPAFACSLVDELTTKMGLEALDSPLVTYETLMQIERPANTIERNGQAEVSPTQEP